MAKNDIVIIDGIIDERTNAGVPSNKRDEAFEFFAVEQILKDFDLSSDEIEATSVDGRDDGGIDAFLIFVNGHLLLDPDHFIWPKSNSEMIVWVVTSKLHTTFQQSPVDKLVATASEVFDFSKSPDELSGAYSEKVIHARNLFHLAYRRLSSSLKKFQLNVVYASRGNTDELGDAVEARANHVKTVCNELFGAETTNFMFVGSAELVELSRKVKKFSIELPFEECFSHGNQYVVLVRLEELNKFATNENGELLRYLFDSNVRDYMGLNRVNEDISDTLCNPTSADFWWLNNGVTVLSTFANVIGKSIHIENVQIVNGLQTTETIQRFFSDGGLDSDRSVLIKVLTSEDPAIRDDIIKATNNQSVVELSSLTATDKIQRDIEEVFLRGGYYYERRKNFYKNQGVAVRDIVTPIYVSGAFVSLVLKSPHVATKLKSKFMRNENQYSCVFDCSKPLAIWPKIAQITKSVDSSLDKLRRRGASEGFLKRWRHHVSFVVVAKIIGTYAYTTQDLLALELDQIRDELVKDVYSLLEKEFADVGPRKLNRRSSLQQVWEVAGSLLDIECAQAIPKKNPMSGFGSRKELDEEFVTRVDETLPDQPWKPGMHLEVSQKLKCRSSEVSNAVQVLISTGRRFEQKDGVVFDANGEVLDFDPDRVDVEEIERLGGVKPKSQAKPVS